MTVLNPTYTPNPGSQYWCINNRYEFKFLYNIGKIKEDMKSFKW